MFVQLMQLLAACASLTVSMVANANGTITVTVMPKAAKAGDENLALNTPLCLTGTAEELDEGFVEALKSFTAARGSLTEQVEATNAILEAAKKEAVTKATNAGKKPAGKKSSASSAAASEEEDEEEGSQDEASSTAAPAASTQAATAAAPTNLWE